jgi:hypothetical protein
MSLRSKPLEDHRRAEFLPHLKQAARRASRARCRTILSLRPNRLGVAGDYQSEMPLQHVIPNSVDEAAFSSAAE